MLINHQGSFFQQTYTCTLNLYDNIHNVHGYYPYACVMEAAIMCQVYRNCVFFYVPVCMIDNIHRRIKYQHVSHTENHYRAVIC